MLPTQSTTSTVLSVQDRCYSINDYNAALYRCYSGWTGPSCDTDINECDANPCGEHSTCTNYPGTYQCDCDPGYKATVKGCKGNSLDSTSCLKPKVSFSTIDVS